MSVKPIFSILLFFGLSFTIFAQKNAIVINEKTNLREKPSSKAKIVYTVDKGSKLEIEASEVKDDWYYVSIKKKKGWVRAKNINVLIQEPNRNSVWLYIGRSQRVFDFSVAYFLNVTQLVRHGNEIKYWIKMVPDKKKNYLSKVLGFKSKRRAENFRFNTDLWGGNCSNKDITATKSLFHWKNNITTIYRIPTKNINLKSNSAARHILKEACKISKNF